MSNFDILITIVGIIGAILGIMLSFALSNDEDFKPPM